MSDYIDMTATQLADCLELAERFPGNTGGLSMLDEATLEFGWRYEAIGPVQKAFADARHAHLSSRSPEAWDAAMAAARDLARALRPLGDFRFARCKRQGPCGTCNMVLDGKGECRSSLGHADVEETRQ
ncbi:MAG TPA: hypothetical protein VGH54_11945 [Mycobacterium sp.]|jgi:hypothetical protein|uniref:hypothetical protein n=1 Tax=Mycobacterium sp. TaxID=1785 RepID=UPI002F3F9AF1